MKRTSVFARLGFSLMAGSLFLLGVSEASVSAQEFDLQFDFGDGTENLSTEQFAIFDQVETRYESVITGYQPLVSGLEGALIDVALGFVDGPADFENGTGLLLGVGGGTPSGVSNGGFEFFQNNGTVTFGNLRIDEDDLGLLTNTVSPQLGETALFTVIFHEVGHALGFGTLWDQNNLLDGNNQYIGINGFATFQQEFGPVASSFVPTDAAGAGDNAGHWDEGSVLGGDILSPTLSLGADTPISQTTAASFADLGYTVNVAAVPEPTSAGLLALGGCLLLSRRRKSKLR